jgi:xanthine dehydrogenase accessory factor
LAALRAHAAGRRVAVATLLDGEHAGERLAIIGDEVVGALVGPLLLDRNVTREARGLLEDGKTVIRRFGREGAMLRDDWRVHVRSYALPPKMVIVGANDFSAATAAFAAQIGYGVTICDARDRFVRSSRFSSVAEIRTGWPQDVMRDIELGARDVVLGFTHDPKFDEPALVAALGTEAGYIGALGSRKTTADREDRVRRAGVSDGELARIHAPCGLGIGSRTAEETAISVLAEIISVRARRAAMPLRETGGSIHSRELAISVSTPAHGWLLVPDTGGTELATLSADDGPELDYRPGSSRGWLRGAGYPARSSVTAATPSRLLAASTAGTP